MMRQLIDTITAISTPPGEGGIGIVRMSGPDSVPIAGKIFVRMGGTPFEPVRSHLMVYGFIKDPATGEKIDEVMVTAMLAPKSFTTEDVVEISCHGGMHVTGKILELTLEAGARLSTPGEFTRRAFLNGRINLTQAEGIIDLIHSKSDMAHRAAIAHLDNNLVDRISGIKQRLFNVALQVESTIDFSEEDIDTVGRAAWCRETEEGLDEIRKLMETYDRGKIVREGIKIAIVGRPNVGKSSLLNRLLNRERAIVSHLPGTTRDTIEEKLSVNGLTVQLIDTAGVQETRDPVEQEGIKRSHLTINEADILLLLFDGSEPLTGADTALITRVEKLQKPALPVLNKVDKNRMRSAEALQEIISRPLFRISAREDIGIEELIEGLCNEIWRGKPKPADTVMITRRRHFDLLLKAKAAVQRGVKVLREGRELELFAEDIKEGVMALGEMTGETYSEEILDRIFSEFCIGK